MIHAELKSILCADIDDLTTFQPAEAANFGLTLQLIVGSKDATGGEAFQVQLCTPLWLTEYFNHDDIIIARHFLVAFEYNYDRLVTRINTHLASCSGETWAEVANKVGRLGLWEFEDYSEFKG